MATVGVKWLKQDVIHRLSPAVVCGRRAARLAHGLRDDALSDLLDQLLPHSRRFVVCERLQRRWCWRQKPRPTGGEPTVALQHRHTRPAWTHTRRRQIPSDSVSLSL